MNILLVYPEKENNTRSLLYNLGLNLRRKNTDPLELVEISIELPIPWKRKLVDLNQKKLKKKDILWADLIIVKASENQIKSATDVATLCNSFQKKIIVQSDLNEAPVWSTKNTPHPNFNEALKELIDDKTLASFLDTGFKKNKMLENIEYSLIDFSARLRNRLQIITD